jgi:hypothetical protein
MSCVLQDDLKMFVSEPQPPPQGIEILKEGKPKPRSGEKSAKAMTPSSWRTPPTTTMETLRDRFQLRSRFSRPGLPHVPLVQDPPASLEASLAAPPRKPRNPTRKRVAKKLRISETTPQEVSCLD